MKKRNALIYSGSIFRILILILITLGVALNYIKINNCEVIYADFKSDDSNKTYVEFYSSIIYFQGDDKSFEYVKLVDENDKEIGISNKIVKNNTSININSDKIYSYKIELLDKDLKYSHNKTYQLKLYLNNGQTLAEILKNNISSYF